MSTTKNPSPRVRTVQRPGDRIFSGAAVTAGALILAVLAAVAAFLLIQGAPAITTDPHDIPMLEGEDNFWTFVGPLVFGTLWAAFLALVMAVPLSIGIALFISHFAPRPLAATLGYVIDLLAAVPSVVFGLWGANILAPAILPFYKGLADVLDWIPLFQGPAVTGRTILTAAIVLAVMVIPIVTAICREVFLQTPRLHEEAALALGATRWEVIKTAVLPFARPGIISAAMLGLGRALGETMAVAMVLSATGALTINLIGTNNPSTIAANVALRFPEASGINVNVLIATGLILFAITLVVNMGARYIVNRRKDFSGAN